MTENIKGKPVYTLFEVTKSIRKTIAERYRSTYWIKAEMNKLNYYPQSGHCYPELVEKESGKVIAQVKCTLWKDDYTSINNNFLNILREPLKDGIKILFLATISFDPVHGLSVRIIDIDPGYTLGDLEAEKQESISRLHDEGIYSNNKNLSLPLLPKRIAVISVESSKGYQDFLNILKPNPWGYHFSTVLFPSLLKGEKAVETIMLQLQKIKKVLHHFDAVAIIRGGGGDIGLSCYNNYLLAREIALFPIPVLTGIGHSTNETVAEMISYRNAITPTKLAEQLIQVFHNFSVPVQRAHEMIKTMTRSLISEEKAKFRSEIKLFRSVTGNILMSGNNNVDKLKNEFFNSAFLHMKKEGVIISNIEKNTKNMDPVNVLKRGYSITRFNGKSIKNSGEVKAGENIETILFEGNIISTVKK
jgi:exodeoxyribonuclease VII large subunit